MQIAHFEGNFGDDLNTLLWKSILPARLWEKSHVTLVGIGSILNEQFADPPVKRGDRTFVLGSGAEYGRLPRFLAELEVLAVRGPLTGAVIGQRDKAATDAAALFFDLPAYKKRDGGSAKLFMPHHLTVRDSRWASVAKLAGLTYVDPHWPAETILEMIQDAQLVVAEAMHAAIVADTLRVPWIPLQISPLNSFFKWRDWTLSLALPFEPRSLPAASRWEEQRYRRLRRLNSADGLPPPATAADPAQLIEQFQKRFAPSNEGSVKPEQSRLKSKAKAAITKTLAVTQKPFDGRHFDAAVESLSRAAAAAPFLSEPRKLDEGVDKLRAAVRELESRLA